MSVRLGSSRSFINSLPSNALQRLDKHNKSTNSKPYHPCLNPPPVMLKIWKQTWKKEDSKRSQNGLGRSDTPHTDLDALPIPAPAFDNSQSRNKRTNATVGPTSLHEVERSPKKVKLGHLCDNAPRNLSGHRGPMSDGLSVPPPHPSIFDKAVLRQARSQNSALSPDTRNTNHS
jgi:hypothetical protein